MASRTRKKPPFNKMQFVRENKHLSPAEILSKAKSQGVEISRKYIYNALWIAKGKPHRTHRGKVPPTEARSLESAFAAQFRTAVLELGAARAEVLFAEMVAQVRELISGRRPARIAP